MDQDNIIALVQPGTFKDQLTEVLRQGTQALVLQAVEAEFAAFLESYSAEKLQDGRKRVLDTVICQQGRQKAGFTPCEKR